MDPYGSHLSTIKGWGFDGIGGILSTITFLGGGGNCLPDIVINLRPIIKEVFLNINKSLYSLNYKPINGGGFGGASRIIKGFGVHGLGGNCRIMTGGASGVNLFASCFIIISPKI